MPRKGVYVCKKCGYVLSKRDAVVSGWDSEGSTTHVHCPRCGRIIARYVNGKRGNRLELDRIDKVLLILPFIPLVDMVSTLVLLTFGGKESGPLTGPVYACMPKKGEFAFVTFSLRG